MRVIDLSKPLTNWAQDEGNGLCVWATNAYIQLIRQIQSLVEQNSISDFNFVATLDVLLRVPFVDTQLSTVWLSNQTMFGSESLVAWSLGRKLPSTKVRSEILQSVLEVVTVNIREKEYPDFISTIMRLISLTDNREKKQGYVLTPNSASRSVHRLGLQKRISNKLEQHGIRTLGELRDLTEETVERHRVPGGFSDERLKRIPGFGETIIAEVKTVLQKWGDLFSPSTVLF